MKENRKHERKGIAIITSEGEEWSNLPWCYGVSYDIFIHPHFRVVWLPIPINTIVCLSRLIFHWLKTAGGHWALLDKYRSRGFDEGREYERKTTQDI